MKVAGLSMGLNKDQLIAQDQHTGLFEFVNGTWKPLVDTGHYPPELDITDIHQLY